MIKDPKKIAPLANVQLARLQLREHVLETAKENPAIERQLDEIRKREELVHDRIGILQDTGQATPNPKGEYIKLLHQSEGLSQQEAVIRKPVEHAIMEQCEGVEALYKSFDPNYQ